MNILQTEWWTVGIPPEWWAEQEDEVVVIGDRDDVGCIEISTLCKEQGNFEEAEVIAIAADNGEPGWDWQSLSVGGLAGCYTTYVEDDSGIREWYLSRGPVLLFITYNCALENSGMDDAAIDEILQTLELVAAS
jgi:hypothetical protein